jgi:cysteine desulfurase/selenocysteine lyase
MLDVATIRKDFPILSKEVNGKPLVYLDNGATSQKPTVVIQSIARYYEQLNANVHRGVHTLSQLATDAFEEARLKISNHLNAASPYEVIFTSGTTHGINIVAAGFAAFLKPGDEVLVSALEHHSNIVPWQFLCERTRAVLKVIPMDLKGELLLDNYRDMLSEKTKIVAVNHISNALGTINPVKEMIALARRYNAAVLIDGAQAGPHLRPNVQDLDCDFYTLSAHKMCGPTGIGVLYGKEKWLHALPPFMGGGEMIKEVTFAKSTFADLPHKFEAGTPNIADAIAFGAAVDYLNNVGFDAIAVYEKELLDYATSQLSAINGLHIWGTAAHKASVISFTIGNIHPYDIGNIIDKLGIAVRTGHHCAQPIMDFCKIVGTVRASFSFYNTKNEVDTLVSALKQAKMMLG